MRTAADLNGDGRIDLSEWLKFGVDTLLPLVREVTTPLHRRSCFT